MGDTASFETHSKVFWIIPFRLGLFVGEGLNICAVGSNLRVAFFCLF